MAGAALPAARPRKASRLWWHVHQWVGLKLAIFTSFIFLTGTLAVVSHEIDWLLTPSLRVAPVGGPPAWGRIAVAAAAEPGVAEIRSVAAPTASAFAARVSVRYADGSAGYLHAHPATGRIQGRTGFVDAQRILRNLHRHLDLPVAVGVPIVSSLAVLMLVSLATSLVVYKRWWRGFLKPIRTRDARLFWGDLHRLLGVWSLWFVGLIAATGLWYLVESLGGEAPPLPSAKAAAPVAAPAATAARLDHALAAAHAADPALAVENIRFPTAKSGAFVIEGRRAAWLVRPRADAVAVDAARGRVLLVADARDLDLHQRVSEAADPLHFGTFGGYWTKVPWFLFGLALTALSVSGIAIYGLRIGRRAGAGALATAWSGMGAWRWPACAAVATGLAMIALLIVRGGGAD